MAARLLIRVAFALLLAASFGWPALGVGGAHAAEAAKAGRVFVPSPPKGKGDKCVADTDFMRRYHMQMLTHQRDDTVHEGIRTKRFSLKECIDCHAVNGPDGTPVTVESPKHFCRTCHDYAAVSIDCFQCHASRPEPDKATAVKERAHDGDQALRAALDGYLKERQP